MVLKRTSLEKLTSDEQNLWASIHQVHDIITQSEESVLKETDVTAQQLVVLGLMEFIKNRTGKPVIITDLASRLYRSITSISTIVYRMENKGLIEKLRDLPDRRAIRLKITRKGEKKHIEALEPNRRLIKSLLSVYSKDEMRTLTSLLLKLKRKAEDEHYVEPVDID